MLPHFGNKSANCKSCIPFKGFRVISIIIIGSIIGFIATHFVQPPPSVKILMETKHDRNTDAILEKLNNIEQDVLLIKEDILYIKRSSTSEVK